MQDVLSENPLLFVALVDDEPRIREFIREVLTSAGVIRRCESFEDPLAFLEFLQETQEAPDVVILDVHFQNSGLTGVDILPFIREIYPYMAVVLLTGMEGEDIQDAEDFECTYYIPKPFAPEHLARMVGFYVGKARKSGRRMADLSRNLEEHKELLDILEQELSEAKVASLTDQRPVLAAKQAKAFDRVKEILTLALQHCLPMPSFFEDLENVFLYDSKLMQRVVETVLFFDKSPTGTPGLNVHKYIDIEAENIYSLRLSRKARLFFYRSARSGNNLLLRLDWEHDTGGMIKWLRSNYATYSDKQKP